MFESFRYFTGRVLNQPGLRELFRGLYLAHAKSYSRARSSYLTGAWVRRSVLTEDFVPAMSDLDLTFLISLKHLGELYRNSVFQKTLLVRDIQIVAEEFFPSWIRTGGFRNRQFEQWKELIPSPELTYNPVYDINELAFELGHEACLIYFQLEPLLKKKNVTPGEIKLCKELERLKVFWKTVLPETVIASRSLFDVPYLTRGDMLFSLEEFAGDVLLQLDHPMGTFNLTPLVRKSEKYGDRLHLTMQGKEVFLLRDPCKFEKTDTANMFVISEKFLRLIKGIGVQEQALLNQAGLKPGYYRDFNRQRLAHDLIQALLLEPDNSSQIFYCFKNIKDFLPELKSDELDELPTDPEELIRIAMRHLAVLASST